MKELPGASSTKQMGKQPYTLGNLKSLAISQRAFSSTVALALLKERYWPGMPNWMKLEGALARAGSTAPSDAGTGPKAMSKRRASAQIPSAYTFREGWDLKHRFQRETIEALVDLAGLPEYAGNLGRLENVREKNPDPSDFLGRLMLALFALEVGSPTHSGNSLRPAMAVIASSRECWKPNDAGWIEVPPYLRPGVEGLAERALKSQGGDMDLGNLLTKTGQETATLRIPPKVRKTYAEIEPRFWPEYLAAVLRSTDFSNRQPLPRWAMDLVSSVLASQALLLRESHKVSFNTHYRKLARFNHAVANFFLNTTPRTSVSQILRLVWGEYAVLRPLTIANAWTRARIAFQTQLLELGVCPESLWHVWEAAHAHVESAGRGTSGSPYRLGLRVVPDGTSPAEVESSMEKNQQEPKRIASWFLGKLTRPARSLVYRFAESNPLEIRDQVADYVASEAQLLDARKKPGTPAALVPVINRRTCPLGPESCRCAHNRTGILNWNDT
ncbi:MAG: hypothetical protein U1F39_06725 [Steroidobacteraceae bacterium]